MFIRRLSIIVSIYFLFSPLFVFAQTATLQDPTAGLPTVNDVRKQSIINLLDVKVNPENPGPNEKVSITIESYITDLSKAMVGWSVNGQSLGQGIGKTTFSFKTGSAGSETNLSISILTNTGDSVVKNLSFRPLDVSVLWEADTYTPPFYKGKALITPQARVRAIALPNTTSSNALSADNFVFVWKKDGVVSDQYSGFGKNSYSFPGPIPFGEMNVSANVSTLRGTGSSDVFIKIPLVQPFVLFYENHPLLGVWYNRPLSRDIPLSKKELSISAEPYFFSNENPSFRSIQYRWELNDASLDVPGRMITLRNDAGNQGDSLLTLAVINTRQTFQSSKQLLNVHFTAEETVKPTF